MKFCPLSCVCLSLIALSFAVAAQASGPELTDVVTRTHTIQVQGSTLRYESEAGRVAIADVETGLAHGYMYYTAYRVPSPARRRPLTFVWNGGPGADSSLLHFSAAGPRRVEDGRLRDNEQTWLTDTDLVFVDPIGTGFSRPASTEFAGEFYDTRGDVASVTEFVRAWRLLHGTPDSGLYLAGESWGARRAASVAYALLQRQVRVDGIFLISGGWGLSHEYLDASLRSALPAVDMAAAALHYGKGSAAAGASVEQVRGDVTQWVHRAYAPALLRRDALSDDERRAVIEQLSAYIGVASEAVDARTLVVSPGEFRRRLLKDRGLTPYIFDLRRTAAPGQQNDAAMLDYLRHDIGYRTSLPYIGLEELTQGFAPNGTYPTTVGERWDYATEKLSPEQIKAAMEAAQANGDGPPRLGAPLPATEEALALNPHLRVLIAAGLYDSFLPCAVGEETQRHLPASIAGSIVFRCYAGGHAMYLDAPVRKQVADDVRRFVKTCTRSPDFRACESSDKLPPRALAAGSGR